MTNVAVIGAGLIGRAWSIVFARAGFNVTLWDQFPLQTTPALAFIADRLPELRAGGPAGRCTRNGPGPHRPMQSMWEAVRDADYIQENGPERTDIKTGVFTELERAARPDAMLASVLLRHPGQRLHRTPGNPAPLPDRASGEPALSGAAGRDLSRRRGPTRR